MLVTDFNELRIGHLDMIRSLDLISVVDVPELNQIGQLVSRTFAMPIVLISLLNGKDLQVVSHLGLADECASKATFVCMRVLEYKHALIIEDLSQDRRFCDHPLVAQETHLRFCVSTPLLTTSGHAIGVLCMADTVTRQFAVTDLGYLNTYAAIVVARLKLRRLVGRVDSVSSLPNRQQFLADMAAIDDGSQHGYVACMVEVFDMQSTNFLTQSKGALPFESLIRQAGQRISAQLPIGLDLYHVAVTRFAFALAPISHESLLRQLTNLVAAFAEPFIADGVYLRASCRIGVVPFVPQERHDLLRRAVIAIQSAIDSEQSWAYYDAIYDAQIQRKFRMAADAPQALREREFYLQYQPRLDFHSGRYQRVEALLRWRHSELGDLGPAEFVPIIEKTAFVPEVTAWVMDHALAQLAQWQQQGLTLVVSVNVSALDFVDGALPRRVASLCLRHKISPQQLELEVTEGEWMGHDRSAMEQLMALRAFGVAIYIDDFGAGFSNFGYLSRLPLDGFKIDRELVTGADNNPQKIAILTAIMQMARTIGVRLVGEGIETAEQASLLTRLGFDEGQGFHISPPISPDAITAACRGQTKDPSLPQRSVRTPG